MRLMGWLGILVFCGCGATSYGISADGTFPPRPAASDFPNWEHQCVVVTRSNASEVLNSSGKQGFELVGLMQQNGNDLMCFKRAKPAGRGN